MFFVGFVTGLISWAGLGYWITRMGWFGLAGPGVKPDVDRNMLYTYASAKNLVDKNGCDGLYHVGAVLCSSQYEPAFEMDMTISDIPSVSEIGRNRIGAFQFESGTLAKNLSVQVPNIPGAHRTKHVVLFDTMDGILLAAAAVDLEGKQLPAIVRWPEGLMSIVN